MTTITPFLWFNADAADAIKCYRQVFPDTAILHETRMPDGSLFIASIRLQGQELILMNGGPSRPHTEAFSLSVVVETQEEVDRISEQLIGEDGIQDSCGWLKDSFGLSWQVVPCRLEQLMSDPDPVKAGRVSAALMQMKRISVQGLQDAYDDKA